MDLKKQNILFFTRIMNLGGTEKVILQLCEIFKTLVNKIVVCSCGGISDQKLQEMGIKHYEIYDIDDKALITILNNIKVIKEIIKNENITIIHTHHRMAAFYVEIMKLYKKCYCFNTCHNTFYNKKILTRFVYRHTNLITCGEMVKRNLVEFFKIPGNRITVIHNAIKPFDGNIIPNTTIENMKKSGFFVVGNIGRLSKQKGMEYFIKAIPDIINKYPNTRFVIVGDGKSKIKLELLAKELHISNYIVFLGYCPDVQNVMVQMDLIVLSSLWEGLPLTPIEAFSVGKTIIATAVDGTIEVVENEKCGFLIEPKKPEQIAEKVIWIIEHPEEKKSMEQEAKKRYEQEFSVDRLSKAYIDFYERIRN